MNLAFTPSLTNASPLPPLVFEQVLNTGADYTRLTNAVSIERKLEEIRRKRLPLTLHVYKNNRDYVFQSSIQALEPGSNRAILTQLTPSSWRYLIQEKLHATISCYMPNGHLLFDSTVFPFENAETSTSLYCLLDIPGEMHKQQLRSSYRVSTLEHEAHLSLWVDNGKKKFSGKCLDLSLNGCCGQFSDELQDYLSAGDDDSTVNDPRFALQLALGNSLRFETLARICRSKPQEGGKLTLGINFVDVRGEAQRNLQRSLSVIQRQQLRYVPEAI
jgi:c-di-GMP-binding flagellar brake protein YcgR